TLVVQELRIDGLDGTLAVGRGGAVNLLQITGLSPNQLQDVPVAIDVHHVIATGRLGLLLGGLPVDAEQIRLQASARVDRGLALSGLLLQTRIDELTDLARVEGGLAFNGQDLDVQGLRVRSGETDLTLDGGIDALFAAGNADVAVTIHSANARTLPVLTHRDVRAALTGDGRLTGSWKKVNLHLNAAGTADLGVDLTADFKDPSWPWTLHLDLGRADLHGLVEAIPAGTTATGVADLKGSLGPEGPDATGRFEGRQVHVLGLDFATLATDLALRGTTLELHRGAAHGDVGQVMFEGALDLNTVELDLGAVATVGLQALGPVGAPPGLRGVARADLRLTGSVQEDGLALDGTIALQDASFRGFEVAPSSVVIHGRLDPALRLAAIAAIRIPEIHGKGVVIQRFSADLPVEWAPNEALEARGRAHISRAAFTDLAHADGATVDLTLYAASHEPLRATARVVLADVSASAVHIDRVVATASVQGDRASAHVLAYLPHLAPIRAKAELNLATDQVRLTQVSVPSPAGPAWELGSPASGKLGINGISDLTIDLVNPRGAAHVEGRVGDAGVDLVVDAHQIDVALLQDWMPELHLPLSGLVDVRAEVRGRGALAANVSFEGDSLAIGDGPPDLAVAGTLRSQEEHLRVDVRVLQRSELLATVTGTLPVGLHARDLVVASTDGVDLTVEVPSVSLARLARVLPDKHLQRMADRFADGTAQAQVRLTGAVGDPTIGGEVAVVVQGPNGALNTALVLGGSASHATASGDVVDSADRRLVRLNAEVDTGASALLGWVLRRGPRPDLASPTAFLKRTDATATLNALPVVVLADLAGLPLDVQGTVDGAFHLAGDGLVLRPSGRGNLSDGRLGDTVRIEAARLSLSEEGTLEVQADLRDEIVPARGRKTIVERGSIHVIGVAPAVVHLARKPADWLGVPLDLQISGEGLPLAAARALDPEVLDTRGWVAIDGHIGGTALHPDMDLRVGLEDGALRYRELGVRAERIHLALRAQGDTFFVDELTLHTRPARRSLRGSPSKSGVKVAGSARLGDLAEGQLDLVDLNILAAVDRSVVLSRHGQIAQVSTLGPLTLQGTALHPIVKGAIRVDLANVSLDRATLMEAGLWPGPTRTLDPRIRLIREGELQSVSRSKDQPFWAPITAKLHIELSQGVEGGLSLPYLDGFGAIAAEASTIHATGELVGEVDLEIADGKAYADGRVEVVGGTADVVRSHFSLDGGTVTFRDRDPFQPYVLVRGSMPLAGGGAIDMALRGTPLAAEAHFTSGQIDEPDQVIAAVITGSSPASGDSNSGIAVGLAYAVFQRAIFGDLQTGAISWRHSMLNLDLDVSRTLRLTPRVGLFSTDLVALDLRWRPSSSVTLDGTLGTTTIGVGALWRRRY
ncbi:MAG: hypothetical protein ACI9MC_002190, partial [Kiritimatiellia bacterium]